MRENWWKKNKDKPVNPLHRKGFPICPYYAIRAYVLYQYGNAGMDIKTLQYVMGYSDVGVTLNVYTHASYDRAVEQMAKILDFKETDMHGKQRKSG